MTPKKKKKDTVCKCGHDRKYHNDDVREHGNQVFEDTRCAVFEGEDLMGLGHYCGCQEYRPTKPQREVK
jgi:hypothetical protein